MTSRPPLEMPPPTAAVLPEIVTLVSVRVALVRRHVQRAALAAAANWLVPLPPVIVTPEIAACVPPPEILATRLLPFPLMTVERASAPRIDMLASTCSSPIVST